MQEEMLSQKLPDIDERERGIFLSILLMLNLYIALAQTALAFWQALTNLLNYPANLVGLLILALAGFYLATVIGVLSWKKWAYGSYIGMILVGIALAFFYGQPNLVIVQIVQLILFVALSYGKFNLFD